MNREDILELVNQFYPGGASEREIAFARFVINHERENFCAFLLQAYDAYVLQSDSTALRERGSK